VRWSSFAFESVADLLARRTGLVFPDARFAGVETGIRRAMARAGVADPDRYRDLVEKSSAALDDLVVELTVGETYFFREPAQFQFLRSEVLPELRRRGTAVRAWSAACASGEEAYSLAILFEQEAAGPRTHLLATDISRAALAKARTAVYGPWSLRGEGAAAALPFLQPYEGRYLVAERVRRRVHFEYLNLALDAYPSLTTDTWGMNIILCRNVLIYFDQETIQAVARRLYQALAPGGWLLTAASDPPLAPYARYETVTTDAGILYQRDPEAPTRPFAFGVVIGEYEGKGTKAVESVQAVERAPAIEGSHGPVVPLSTRFMAENVRAAPSEAVDPLADAQQAFAAGDYERAVRLTRDRPDEAACVLHVRSMANLDAARGATVCADATERLPLSVELHYLLAILLGSLGRNDEAVQAVRRVLYLDRSLAVGYFTLGSLLTRSGDLTGARRAYRNAYDICRTRPAEEEAPLSDGESVGRLGEAAAAQRAILDEAAEKVS
jgi:chemotaxis protein methyltransferase CheR